MVSIFQYIGQDLISMVKDVCEFRKKYFRGYPYMYDAEYDPDYESRYISGYAEDKKSMLVVAKNEANEIVGVSTAMPLCSDSEILHDAKDHFLNIGVKLEDVYYYGEVIIHPLHRRQGLAKKMYQLHEEQSKKWGYTHACIATVIRDLNDPRKPDNYLSTDEYWPKLGFSRMSFKVNYEYPTILENGESQHSSNPFAFWIKRFA